MVCKFVCAWEFVLHNANDMVLLCSHCKSSVLFILVKISQYTIILEVIWLGQFVSSLSEFLFGLIVTFNDCSKFVLLVLSQLFGFNCIISLVLKLNHSVFSIFGHFIFHGLFLRGVFLIEIHCLILSSSS